jgi:beta-lactamase class A
MEDRLSLGLALAALLLFPPPARAAEGGKEDILFTKLRGRVERLDAQLDGILGLYVRDLKTGRSLELRADEVFPAASTIKVAVLYDLYRQAAEGRLDLAEVTRPPLPRVRGGGALQELGDQVSLTWRDMASLMLAFSDNEATNQLIGKLGMDSVNHRLDVLGLTRTRLRRRMMDLDAARRGDENVSTPSELARLMLTLREGTGLDAARAKDLREVAALPRWDTASIRPPFLAPLPESVKALEKSGELEGVRAAVAVVELERRPYVAAIMTTHLRRDADGEAVIRDISALLFETFDRFDRASDLGRIISER